MIQSINRILRDYNIDGDIILYRDADHKKKKLCEYIKNNLVIHDTDEVCTYSDGAFGLYLSRALPGITVHTCYNGISPDYGELLHMQPNLILNEGMRRPTTYQNFVKSHPEYIAINQYTDDIVKDYYKKHFADIVEEVKELNIDAFCDYGHSGATLRGFVEANLVDWKFIMASIDLKIEIMKDYMPRYRNHMGFVKDKLHPEFCVQLDTYELGVKIENTFPQFGNVYEATRSIAGAINWLSKNPNKTVLVYVGDAPNKEGTKFRGNSLSRVGTKELFFNFRTWKNLKNNLYPTIYELQDYYDLFSDCDTNYKKYIFSNLLTTYCGYCFDFGVPNKASHIKFINNIKSISPVMADSTLNIVNAFIKEDKYNAIKKAVKLDEAAGNDLILQKFAYEKTDIDDMEKYHKLVVMCEEVKKIFMKMGSLL